MSLRTRIGLCALTVVLVAGIRPSQAAEDHRGQNRAGVDWSGKDKSGANCEETDFHYANLAGTNFTAANLRGADLTSAVLNRAILAGADLTGATFHTTQMQDANCSLAKMRGIRFDPNTVTTGVNFFGADLRGISGLTQITKCDFSGADLRGANLRVAVDWTPGSAKFAGALYDDETVWPKAFGEPPQDAVLKPLGADDAPEAPPVIVERGPRAAVGTGKQMPGVDKRANDLQGRSFDDANLQGAILRGADLRDAKFRRVNLRGADLRDARLDGTDFTGSDLREASLAGAHVTTTNFTEANLAGVDLSKAWGLSEAKFRRADLRGGSVAHPTITRCDFKKADLRGTVVAGPAAGYYTTCDWRECVYDRTTRWPKGFDAAGAGAVLRTDPKDPGAFDLDPEDGVPPRLLAPDRDPAAPPEHVVKRLLLAKLDHVRGEIIGLVGFGKGAHESLPVDATSFTVELTRMTYLPKEVITMEEFQREAYPVRIGGDLIFEASDGSEMRAPFDWVTHVYDEGNGKWNLKLPEGK